MIVCMQFDKNTFIFFQQRKFRAVFVFGFVPSRHRQNKCILQKYSEVYSWQVCDGPNIEKNIQKKKKNNPEKTKRDQSSVRRQKKR